MMLKLLLLVVCFLVGAAVCDVDPANVLVVQVAGSLSDGAGIYVFARNDSTDSTFSQLFKTDSAVGPLALARVSGSASAQIASINNLYFNNLNDYVFAAAALPLDDPLSFDVLVRTEGGESTNQLIPSSVDAANGAIFVGSTGFGRDKPQVNVFSAGSPPAKQHTWTVEPIIDSKTRHPYDDVFLKSSMMCSGSQLYVLWSGEINNDKVPAAWVQVYSVSSKGEIKLALVNSLPGIFATSMHVACAQSYGSGPSANHLFVGYQLGILHLTMNAAGTAIATTQPINDVPEVLSLAPSSSVLSAQQTFFAVPSLDVQSKCNVFKLVVNATGTSPSQTSCVVQNKVNKNNYLLSVAGL